VILTSTKPGLVDRATIENVVVLIMVSAFVALVAVGLVMAYQGMAIDKWETIALFFSGFFTGILTAYGLFKSPNQPTGATP